MRKTVALLGLVAALYCGAAHAGAATYTWTGLAGNTDWQNSANWSPNTGFPGTDPGDTANFQQLAPAADITATLNANVTLTNVTFAANMQRNVTINAAAAQTLTFVASGSIVDNTNVAQTSSFGHNIACTVILNGALNINTVTNAGTAGKGRFTGAVTGAAGVITKNGIGEWQIDGITNTYGTAAGTHTIVTNGILWLRGTNVANSVTGPGNITINGGTLDVGSNLTTTMASGNISMSSGTLRGDGRTNGTINVTGGSFQGPLTIAGSVTINNATITPRGDGAISGGTGAITFVNPADLTVTNSTLRIDFQGAALSNNCDRINGVRNLSITNVTLVYASVGISSSAGSYPNIITNTGTKSVAFLTNPTTLNFRDIVTTQTATAMNVNAFTTVRFVNSTTPNGGYGLGAVINVTVVFWDNVIVTGGPPQITLETGTTDRTLTMITPRTVNDNQLFFSYTVQAGDTSPDLDYTTANSLVLNGATINTVEDLLTANIVLAAPGAANSLSVTKDISISTSSGTVVSVSSFSLDGNYATGQTVDVTITFDRPAFVTGTPQIQLETGATDGIATYTSGSGSTTLRFTYTVGAGESSADLDYTTTAALTLNGGTIEDSFGNAITLTLPAPGGAGSLANSKSITINLIVASSITPGVGPVIGGTQVTISGAFFVTGATVTFDGTAANNVNVIGSSTITATAPAHLAGVVDVVITNPGGGSATLAGGFTYNAPPAITSEPTFSPSPANVNQTLSFSVLAADPESDALTYTWIYGDGASDATGQHAYTTAGVYQVRVDIRDGVNVITRTIQVPVGVGTVPNPDGPSAVVKMKVLSLQAVVKSGGQDSVKLSVEISGLPPNLELNGKALIVSVGGAQKTFILDERGKAVSAKIKGKFTKNRATKRMEFKGGTAVVQAKYTGSFANVWKDEGLDATITDLKAGTFVNDVTLDVFNFTETTIGVISTKAFKGGKFTFKR